jgi:hypothetical protein
MCNHPVTSKAWQNSSAAQSDATAAKTRTLLLVLLAALRSVLYSGSDDSSRAALSAEDKQTVHLEEETARTI